MHTQVPGYSAKLNNSGYQSGDPARQLAFLMDDAAALIKYSAALLFAEYRRRANLSETAVRHIAVQLGSGNLHTWLVVLNAADSLLSDDADYRAAAAVRLCQRLAASVEEIELADLEGSGPDPAKAAAAMKALLLEAASLPFFSEYQLFVVDQSSQVLQYPADGGGAATPHLTEAQRRPGNCFALCGTRMLPLSPLLVWQGDSSGFSYGTVTDQHPSVGQCNSADSSGYLFNVRMADLLEKESFRWVQLLKQCGSERSSRVVSGRILQLLEQFRQFCALTDHQYASLWDNIQAMTEDEVWRALMRTAVYGPLMVTFYAWKAVGTAPQKVQSLLAHFADKYHWPIYIFDFADEAEIYSFLQIYVELLPALKKAPRAFAGLFQAVFDVVKSFYFLRNEEFFSRNLLPFLLYAVTAAPGLTAAQKWSLFDCGEKMISDDDKLLFLLETPLPLDKAGVVLERILPKLLNDPWLECKSYRDSSGCVRQLDLPHLVPLLRSIYRTDSAAFGQLLDKVFEAYPEESHGVLFYYNWYQLARSLPDADLPALYHKLAPQWLAEVERTIRIADRLCNGEHLNRIFELGNFYFLDNLRSSRSLLHLFEEDGVAVDPAIPAAVEAVTGAVAQLQGCETQGVFYFADNDPRKKSENQTEKIDYQSCKEMLERINRQEPFNSSRIDQLLGRLLQANPALFEKIAEPNDFSIDSFPQLLKPEPDETGFLEAELAAAQPDKQRVWDLIRSLSEKYERLLKPVSDDFLLETNSYYSKKIFEGISKLFICNNKTELHRNKKLKLISPDLLLNFFYNVSPLRSVAELFPKLDHLLDQDNIDIFYEKLQTLVREDGGDWKRLLCMAGWLHYCQSSGRGAEAEQVKRDVLSLFSKLELTGEERLLEVYVVFLTGRREEAARVFVEIFDGLLTLLPQKGFFEMQHTLFIIETLHHSSGFQEAVDHVLQNRDRLVSNCGGNSYLYLNHVINLITFNCGDPALPLLIEQGAPEQEELFTFYFESLRLYPRNRCRIREHFLRAAGSFDLLPRGRDYQYIDWQSQQLSALLKELGPVCRVSSQEG